MNNIIRKVFLLAILGLIVCSNTAIGQESDSLELVEPKDLPSEQVEVIKLFQARLEDAKKINIEPESPESRILETFSYEVNIRPLELNYLEPVIRPIAMIPDAKKENKNGFVRVGYGNLNTYDASLGYNYLTRRETEINLNGDFLQMNDRSELFKQFQSIESDLNLNHNVGPLLSIGARANYDRKALFFFGSDIDSTETDTSKYRRNINRFGLGLQASNGEENVYGLNYNLDLNYEFVNLANEILQENNFLIQGGLDKSINDQISLGLEARADISSISDTSSRAYNNYFVKPKMNYSNGKIQVKGGIDFAFTADGTKYLPDIQLSYSPIDYGFIPYIFWKGDVQKNNYSNVLQFNPFLSEDLSSTLANTEHYRYGIGSKGSLKAILYDVNVSYGKANNLILFRSFVDDLNRRKFLILSDTAQILEINGGFSFDLNQNVTLKTDFNFSSFDLNKNERPWHLPNFRFDFEAQVNLLNEKLLLRPKLFLRDGVSILNTENTVEELNTLVDFNLQAEYKIRSWLSAYAGVHNLLASEYQQWNNYSQYGLNAIIGLKAVF